MPGDRSARVSLVSGFHAAGLQQMNGPGLEAKPEMGIQIMHCWIEGAEERATEFLAVEDRHKWVMAEAYFYICFLLQHHDPASEEVVVPLCASR